MTAADFKPGVRFKLEGEDTLYEVGAPPGRAQAERKKRGLPPLMMVRWWEPDGRYVPFGHLDFTDAMIATAVPA